MYFLQHHYPPEGVWKVATPITANSMFGPTVHESNLFTTVCTPSKCQTCVR